jgi:hypothetical protein
MRLRLAATALYVLAILTPVLVTGRSVAFSNDSVQSQRVGIRLDLPGMRGLVLFDHKKHESVMNPEQEFHRAPGTDACIGCHHRKDISDPSIDVTDIRQFQKCTNCHREQGNPGNP